MLLLLLLISSALCGAIARVGVVRAQPLHHEFQVELEPFNILYRTRGFDEMEMLKATRAYITSTLDEHTENFVKLQLYEMTTFEEEQNLAKVLYMGTTFYSVPISHSYAESIKNATLLGFLGRNVTAYRALLRFNDIEVASTTLMTLENRIIDFEDGEIITYTAQEDSTGSTSMEKSMTMTLYLCAILIPAFLVMVAALLKVYRDLDWKQEGLNGPDDGNWLSKPRDDQVFLHSQSDTSNESGLGGDESGMLMNTGTLVVEPSSLQTMRSHALSTSKAQAPTTLLPQGTDLDLENQAGRNFEPLGCPGEQQNNIPRPGRAAGNIDNATTNLEENTMLPKLPKTSRKQGECGTVVSKATTVKRANTAPSKKKKVKKTCDPSSAGTEKSPKVPPGAPLSDTVKVMAAV